MRTRCNNPSKHDAKYYRDKGIHIDPEWDDFERFADWSLKNGYEIGLSLDRINGSKGYNSMNCRWIPLDAQQRNKSNNRFYTYKGKTQTLSEWAREYDIDFKTLSDRLDKFNFSFEEALLRPIKVPRNTKYVLYDNKKCTFTDLEKICGIPRRIIGSRIKSGWSVEKAISEPYERRNISCSLSK